MSTREKNNHLLLAAASKGDLDEVRRLIPLSDPTWNDSWALRIAAGSGHTQCVEILIPVSEPKVSDSWALQNAAEHGHAECVELLIPVSDPKADNSAALRWAWVENNQQCIDLLYPVSDPTVALQTLKTKAPQNPEIWLALEQRIECEHLNAVINQEIGKTAGVKVQRKM